VDTLFSERDSATRFPTSGCFHETVSPKTLNIPLGPFEFFCLLVVFCCLFCTRHKSALVLLFASTQNYIFLTCQFLHRVPRLWPRLPDCSCPSHWAGIPKHVQSTSRHNSTEQGEVKKTLSAVVACIWLPHSSIPLLGKLREVSTCHTERLREIAIQAVSALTDEREGRC
jgi:hypothetical protein